MPRYDELERKFLEKIIEYGTKGILQRNLWRELRSNSREGSRIALKLERKGLIERKRELSEGRWTYRLFSKKRPVNVDSIMDIPCVACPEISKCGMGSVVSPETCKALNQWLYALGGPAGEA